MHMSNICNRSGGEGEKMSGHVISVPMIIAVRGASVADITEMR